MSKDNKNNTKTSIKQVKDLTIQDLINICSKSSCDKNCPIKDIYSSLGVKDGFSYLPNGVKLDREINLEIEEN